MEHIHAFFSFVLIISYAPQCTLGSCLLPRSRASPYVAIQRQPRLRAVGLSLPADALLIAFAYIISQFQKKIPKNFHKV